MKKSYLLVGAVILIAALAAVYWFVFAKGTATTGEGPGIRPLSLLKTQSPSLVPTEPPKTPKPIPSGKKEFIVGSSKKTGPQMSSGYFDPFDPKQGQKQIASINIKSDQPVTKVVLTIKTDNKTRDVAMERKEGTDTNGRWEGTWTVDDTYLFTYFLTLKATSSVGTNSFDLALR